MWQALLPIGRNQFFLRESIDVIAQRERDHVSIKAINYGSRLFAGTAMRLIDGDDFFVGGLPVLGKGNV